MNDPGLDMLRDQRALVEAINATNPGLLVTLGETDDDVPAVVVQDVSDADWEINVMNADADGFPCGPGGDLGGVAVYLVVGEKRVDRVIGRAVDCGTVAAAVAWLVGAARKLVDSPAPVPAEALPVAARAPRPAPRSAGARRLAPLFDPQPPKYRWGAGLGNTDLGNTDLGDDDPQHDHGVYTAPGGY